jgi:hypothetical protein
MEQRGRVQIWKFVGEANPTILNRVGTFYLFGHGIPCPFFLRVKEFGGI